MWPVGRSSTVFKEAQTCGLPKNGHKDYSLHNRSCPPAERCSRSARSLQCWPCMSAQLESPPPCQENTVFNPVFTFSQQPRPLPGGLHESIRPLCPCGYWLLWLHDHLFSHFVTKKLGDPERSKYLKDMSKKKNVSQSPDRIWFWISLHII